MLKVNFLFFLMYLTMFYCIIHGIEQKKAKQTESRMRVFLCTPPTGLFIRDERCQVSVKSRVAENSREPIQMLNLTGYLKENGADVFFKDYSCRNFNVRDTKTDILKFQPEYIVTDSTQGTFSKDVRFVRDLAEDLPEPVYIVRVPAWLNIFEDKVLRIFSGIRAKVFFVIDNPELNISAIINANTECFFIGRGYVYSDGRIESVESRDGTQAVFNIDDLPVPPREFLDHQCYTRPDTGLPIAYPLVSRGCPYNCIYCAAPGCLGMVPQRRSPRKIMEEIHDCISRGINDFFFRADDFLSDRTWVIDFCRFITEEGLNIRWGANGRVDLIDEELLMCLRNAGCEILGFGVESGSQYMLDKINKGIRLEMVEEARALCLRTGMKAFFHFIVGFPWETENTVMETIRFIKRVRPDFIEVNVPYPLFETKLFEIGKDEGLFESDDFEAYSHVKPVMRSFTMSTSEIAKARKMILRSFYLDPKYIIRTLTGLRSPLVMINYIKWGCRFVANLCALK